MQRRFARLVLLFTVLAIASPLHAASPDELRIETKVFAGREEQPVSQNLTLFHAGAVYDYLPDTREVTVFDPRGGRFRLIDPVRGHQAEIETREIDEFCKGLKRWAAEQKDPLLQFAAQPQFEVEFDPERDELLLKHKLLQYAAVAVPVQRGRNAVLPHYRAYCDGYARLGAMLHPGSIPPFVRQQLNAELHSRGLVAESVELTLQPREALGKPLVIRSEHKIAYRLIDSDRKRISQTNEQMANLPTIDWHEYRQALSDAE
ncbi:MAG: hypothetical protein U0836_05815 [Pirellulales bacterium]